MTFGEIYKLFLERCPNVNAVDYRPVMLDKDQDLGMYCTGPKVGIIVWNDNGDEIIFFPTEVNS